MSTNLDNKQVQFLDFILKRVQDNKVDEARKLISEKFEKQAAGTFSYGDIGDFIPKITMLLKPNKVDEVHDVLHQFAASFKSQEKEV
ncbi:MAG TPA: hypothetical protein DCY20_07645 [Firmicutes bacterium]|nr:hypothetical protein [Bacillota bacterium]